MKKVVLLLVVLSFSFASYSQWKTVDVGSYQDINCIDVINANTIYLGSDSLIKSTNGGTTWTKVPMVDNFGIPLGAISSMYFFDANNGFAVGQFYLDNTET